MGDLKVFHSIYPTTYPNEAIKWGQIVRFDDKTIMPGRQEIQNFIGIPMLIIRLIINGSGAYYDSTGYRKILRERDTLVVGYDESTVQSIFYNYDETQEAELLEIWLMSKSNERIRLFDTLTETRDGNFNEASDAPSIGPDSILLQDGHWLRRSTFKRNSDHKIEGGIYDSIIVFVLSGTVIANSIRLGFRDGIMLSMNDTVDLYFEEDTDLLLIQLNANMHVE
ncbi:hypothetical protein [Mucilaginibacter gossypii]|nr:hypothetical protein [Mucilaginibacter gossypii]